MTDYVYFIQRGSGSIKIGVSKNPEERLRSLQTGSHEKLFLIAKMPCLSRANAINMERSLHRRFARFRLHGEWFGRAIIRQIRECSRQYRTELLIDMNNEAKAHITAILKETA